MGTTVNAPPGGNWKPDGPCTPLQAGKRLCRILASNLSGTKTARFAVKITGTQWELFVHGRGGKVRFAFGMGDQFAYTEIGRAEFVRELLTQTPQMGILLVQFLNTVSHHATTVTGSPITRREAMDWTGTTDCPKP